MERLLARLERRFGALAIPNLTYFVVGGMAIVFVLSMVRPEFQGELTLDVRLVLRGQLWRLVTYLFLPTSDSMLWVIFSLWWVHLVGTTLEAEWGAFRLNLFYLVGMLGTTVAAIVTSQPETNTYLNASLFFAFATLFPDYQIRLYFLLPIRVKWLALVSAAFLVYAAVVGDWGTRAAIAVALSNYFLFFGGRLVDMARARNVQVRQAARRAETAPEPSFGLGARVCALCGAREADGADIRVCSCEKCGKPPRALCLEHARNH